MKKYVLLISLFLALSGLMHAQDQSPRPVADKPVYFDVSPPLRDMPAVRVTRADNSWKDGAVMNHFDFYTGFGQQAGVPEAFDPGLQPSFGQLPSDTTVQNFDGQGNAGGVVPPDTHGEAGPDCYFQVVNLSYTIFSKTGQKMLGPLPNSSVWAGMPHNTNSGDAVVLYDEVANRWLFTQFSLPTYPVGPFYQMIAVSQTSDPTGSWYRYEYTFTDMPDYPKFGVWPDGYYMSANRFGNGYQGTGAYAYDRTAMLAGDPGAQRISFEQPAGQETYSLLPSDCDGPFPPAGTPCYFTYARLSGSQHLGIWEFHADWATPGNSTFGNRLFLTVNPFSVPTEGIPQLGTAVRLETLADRLMYDAKFRNFNGYSSMVINHTVVGSSGTAGVRWYELRQTGGGPWTVYQQGTYSPDDGNSRWMGSIAIDTAGSIALGFSVSGPTLYPSIRYTGRLVNDPLNAMTITEKGIMNGGGCQTGIWSGRSRWGDYSGMSVDPSNPTTFWYTQEYYPMTSGSGWQTRIASFTFSNVFSSSASAVPAIVCLGDSSQLSGFAYGGSGNYTWSWTSIPAGFTSDLQSPKVLAGDTTVYILATSDGTLTRHDTVQVKVNFPPTAFAGNDTTVCWYVSPVEIHGTAANYRAVGWATTGDGYFSGSTSLDALYFPGEGDRTAGSVDLKLFAFAVSPCEGKVVSNKHVTFDACTGIAETSTDPLKLGIRPNPARNTATLVITGMTDESAYLTVFDVRGQAVYTGSVNKGVKQAELKLDVSGWSKGTYVVLLKSGKGQASERLVIR
jgi:hypothetical protein